MTTQKDDVSAPAAVGQIPEDVRQIGQQILTQDNRYTDQPLFIVQQKRTYVTEEGYNDDRFEWRETKSGDYIAASDEEAARLESQFQDTREDPDGWKRYCVFDVWEFVTACFTEQGCKDYLARDGHNLKEPRIYAEGSYRNEEFRTLRNWLCSLAAPSAANAPQEGPAEADVIAMLSTLAQHPLVALSQPAKQLLQWMQGADYPNSAANAQPAIAAEDRALLDQVMGDLAGLMPANAQPADPDWRGCNWCKSSYCGPVEGCYRDKALEPPPDAATTWTSPRQSKDAAQPAAPDSAAAVPEHLVGAGDNFGPDGKGCCGATVTQRCKGCPHDSAAAPAFRECRHCGWDCRPNAGAESKWHPLEQDGAAAPAATKWTAGSLLTASDCDYPGMGSVFGQIWQGADLIARVYGDSREEVQTRVNRILSAHQPQEAVPAAMRERLIAQIKLWFPDHAYQARFFADDFIFATHQPPASDGNVPMPQTFATLHDDGYFTFKDRTRYEDKFAGWHKDVVNLDQCRAYGDARALAALATAGNPIEEAATAEAALYRDLTGDAMALGYDGLPAALDALRTAGSEQDAKDALLALLTRIDDAFEAYERYGAICTFEGSPMIHAAVLTEIRDLRAAIATREAAK